MAPFILYSALMGGLCLKALLRRTVFEAEIKVMSFQTANAATEDRPIGPSMLPWQREQGAFNHPALD
jgi:hypothetical protein